MLSMIEIADSVLGPKTSQSGNHEIVIHCFESTGVEGFPSNTYLASDIDSAIDTIRKILDNERSGISRILIENPKFPETLCYTNISAMAPQPINNDR